MSVAANFNDSFNKVLAQNRDLDQQKLDIARAEQVAKVPYYNAYAEYLGGRNPTELAMSKEHYGLGGSVDRQLAGQERSNALNVGAERDKTAAMRPMWEGQGALHKAEADTIKELAPYGTYGKYLDAREREISFNRRFASPPPTMVVSPKKRPEWFTGKPNVEDNVGLPTEFMGSKMNFIPFRYLAGAAEMPIRAWDWAGSKLWARD